MPVSECSFTLESILEDLQKDPWPVDSFVPYSPPFSSI